jgi:hypothetical protein
MIVSTKLEPQPGKILQGKYQQHVLLARVIHRTHRARILQVMRSFIIVFLNGTDYELLMFVACCKFVTVIRMFKMFLPPNQTEFTVITRFMIIFKIKSIYSLFICCTCR